jgi:hypothetical protein
MKSKLITVFLAVTILVISLVAVPTARSDSPKNNILAHALDIELGKVQPQKYEQPLSDGVMYTLFAASGELDRRAEAAKTAPGQLNPPANATAGCPNRYVGGGKNAGPNIKVNQDCSLRRQAEEVIAVNPTNPNNLIAGQNDSRIGYNHCGYAWSFDGGKTWGDQIPPFWSYVLPDGHTADACSDPTATFDADGNAYVGGVLFDVASAANAIVVAKSDAGIGGRFYHSPASGAFQEYGTNLGVVASGNNPAAALDKEFIVADANPGSPKVNNVYATWTFIELTSSGVGIHSPIYFGQSTDGGATWSPGIEISGSSAAYCPFFSGEADPNACDQDQGSHPVVGPDGTIYVAFGNGNLSGIGVEQVLMVSCPPLADCSDPASWTAPAKVGDMFEFHPIGPSTAGCPAGRQCLPPNGYRVPMITSISASIATNRDLFVSWTDGRNIGPNCKVGLVTAQTATPPCDSDILYAYSTDGGATWSSSFNLTPAGSAQWMSWSAVTANGKLWVAYYDRSYGNCEFDGCNDITIAGIDNAATNSPSIKYTRVTTSSMPNLTLDNNPVQAGFLGDYMWVTVNDKGRPLIVWADTRGLNGTVEEDIYFSSLP